VEKGRTVKLGVSTYSEMVAVDAIVVYIQSTPNFPSWASRKLSAKYGKNLSPVCRPL